MEFLPIFLNISPDAVRQVYFRSHVQLETVKNRLFVETDSSSGTITELDCLTLPFTQIKGYTETGLKAVLHVSYRVRLKIKLFFDDHLT